MKKSMNNRNLRVHPSSKCSKCRKSQEDGVELFDYYHIGEGVFCTECRNPDTEIHPNKEESTIKEVPGFNKYGQFYGFD